MHVSADVFAFHHTTEVAHDVHVEHIDGKAVLFAHSCGSDIHHLQAALKHFVVRDFGEFRGSGVFFGVAV